MSEDFEQQTFHTPNSASEHVPNQPLNTLEMPPEIRYGQVQCPRCLKFNAIQSLRCRSCGSILEEAGNLDRIAALKIRTKTAIPVTSSRLTELWDKVLENYDSELRHQDFILSAFGLGCLYFAAQKYARILSASPSEPIALKMQAQIEVLASKDAIRAPRYESPGYSSKIPLLFLVAGIIVMIFGFLLPQAKNLVGVGCAIMVMAGGLRYFISK